MCFHRDLGSGGLIGAGESPPSKRSLEHKLVGRMRVGEGGVRTVFPTSSWNRHVWEDPQLKVSLIAPSLASLFVSSSGNGSPFYSHLLFHLPLSIHTYQEPSFCITQTFQIHDTILLIWTFAYATSHPGYCIPILSSA